MAKKKYKKEKADYRDFIDLPVWRANPLMEALRRQQSNRENMAVSNARMHGRLTATAVRALGFNWEDMEEHLRSRYSDTNEPNGIKSEVIQMAGNKQINLSNITSKIKRFFDEDMEKRNIRTHYRISRVMAQNQDPIKMLGIAKKEMMSKFLSSYSDRVIITEDRDNLRDSIEYQINGYYLTHEDVLRLIDMVIKIITEEVGHEKK